LEINEKETFVDPDTLSGDNPVSKSMLLNQEEEIFQTARLINCGWFGMGTDIRLSEIYSLTFWRSGLLGLLLHNPRFGEGW